MLTKSGGNMALIQKITKRIVLYGEMVMFSHTLFSLPFALITLFLAANGIPEWRILFYSLVALIGGRTGANAFNRYADRKIDQANPRTANRHIPKGLLKATEAMFVTTVSYAVYFFAAYQINEICFYFSIIPVILFTIYPYTKRFTYLCHLFLGFCCAVAVLGAWMAVRNELFFLSFNENKLIINFKDMNYIPVLLFIAVMLWNAGFDIIYGTQDIKHDQAHSIHSIPAKFGLNKALWIARGFHFIMIVLLLALILISQLSFVYGIGILIVSGIFLIEHRIVTPHNPIMMKLASYKLNQVISMTILGFTLIDLFLI
jgi:4-hydroxybenzoate polyprenyltransferase